MVRERMAPGTSSEAGVAFPIKPAMMIRSSASISPAPFGYNLFVVKSITGRGMGEVSMSVLPFLIVSLLGLLIITYIPQVALFFPTVLMG